MSKLDAKEVLRKIESGALSAEIIPAGSKIVIEERRPLKLGGRERIRRAFAGCEVVFTGPGIECKVLEVEEERRSADPST